MPPLPRLHPNLRLLRALPRPRLPLELLILARPVLGQPLRVLDRAVHAPAIDPEAHARDDPPLCDLPGELHPEHDGAVEHAEDLEGEPEDGNEGEDGGDVRLGDDLGDERGEVRVGGAVDAEEGGYEVDEGVGEGGGEEVVEEREVVWGKRGCGLGLELDGWGVEVGRVGRECVGGLLCTVSIVASGWDMGFVDTCAKRRWCWEIGMGVEVVVVVTVEEMAVSEVGDRRLKGEKKVIDFVLGRAMRCEVDQGVTCRGANTRWSNRRAGTASICLA